MPTTIQHHDALKAPMRRVERAIVHQFASRGDHTAIRRVVGGATTVVVMGPDRRGTLWHLEPTSEGTALTVRAIGHGYRDEPPAARGAVRALLAILTLRVALDAESTLPLHDLD
jgi:hypothetical protein